MKVPVLNIENQVVKEISVPDKAWLWRGKIALLHQVIAAYLANQRLGLAKAKTRGEISGGGHKPWRQKGTGRARVGSIRSPLWRKGGVVGGPQPRSFAQKVNRKMKVLALQQALAYKYQQKTLRVLESLPLEQAKTKYLAAALRKLDMWGRKVLIVTNGTDRLIYLAARNLPGVEVQKAVDLNAYHVCKAEEVLIIEPALQTLLDRLGFAFQEA